LTKDEMRLEDDEGKKIPMYYGPARVSVVREIFKFFLNSRLLTHSTWRLWNLKGKN